MLIPAGSFTMGSYQCPDLPDEDECPARKVSISRPFYLGTFEVTQEERSQIMSLNPSKFKGKRNPVERVSWYDAQKFIAKLNEKEKTDKYRLPTEAEWEYAAKAGKNSTYASGESLEKLGDYAWYEDNSEKKNTL